MCTADALNNERILVQRLIEGDEEAFCELYAAYKNRLIFFAMYIILVVSSVLHSIQPAVKELKNIMSRWISQKCVCYWNIVMPRKPKRF